MDTTIITDSENPLLNRREVTADINHAQEPTPSETVARKEIGKALTVDPECVKVNTINTGHGTNTARVNAHVFEEPVSPLRDTSDENEEETEADADEEETSDDADEDAGEEDSEADEQTEEESGEEEADEADETGDKNTDEEES